MTASLPEYTSYKDIGEPWIGQVPSHWGVERGKRLFTKAQRPAIPTDETVTCFRDGVVTLRKNRRLRGFTEALKEIGYQGVRCGDLVIHAMDAFAGAVGVSDSDGKCSPVYQVCLPRTDANAKYYAFLVREMSRSQWIMALAKGIRERSTDFRFETFGNQFLPVPPVSEQAAIVRYLASVDRKVNRFIRAKRRLIEVLTEQKQAIITHAVTKGLNPQAPLKPSGIDWLGDVPEHWEVRRIKSLSLVKRGASPRPIHDSKWFDESAGEYAWVRIADVTASERYLVNSTQRLSALGAERSVKMQPGSLFLSIAATVGKPMITKIKCCIHDGFVYFPHFTGNAEFLYYVFASGAMYGGLGKVGTQLNLNTDTVGAICVGWPRAAEQAAIVAHLDMALGKLNATIAAIKREIDLIREYRTRLVADVVTGKVDVRAAAASLPLETEEPVDSIPDDDSGDEDVEVESVEEAADVAQ